MPRKIIDFLSIIDGEEVLSRKCSQCILVKKVEDFTISNSPGKNIKTSICRSCRNQRAKNHYQRNKKKGNPYPSKSYQDMARALPKEWESRDYINLVKEFNFKCAISEVKSIDEDLGVDHFVAISTGHGGTIKENLLPVSRTINCAKNNKNPFEWIKERPDLDIEVFEYSVNYLAELNGLTPTEYKEYVYWCFENPRSLEQVSRDTDTYGFKRNSVDIWRDRRADNKEVS